MGEFRSTIPSRGAERDNYSSTGPASWVIAAVFLSFACYVAIRVWILLRKDKKREKLGENEVMKFAEKIKRKKQ